MLSHVAEQSTGATAKEIAGALGLALPTAYHLLGTLVSEGLLMKDSQRRYWLGPRLGTIADAYARQFTPPDYLIAPLHRLAAATGDTAYVAAWQLNRIAVLASVEGRNTVRVSGTSVGFAEAAHARASGKALLAFAPESVRHAYLVAYPLVRVTEHTIVDPREFQLELERTRRRCFAIDEEEFREGIACAAAPVLQGETAIAALSLSAPIARFRQHRRALIEHLREAVREAEREAATNGRRMAAEKQSLS
jgi:DNA-binding IclR family transcriptional regulator